MIVAANIAGDLVLFDAHRNMYRCIAPPIGDEVWHLIGRDAAQAIDPSLVEGLSAQGIDIARCRRADANLIRPRRDIGSVDLRRRVPKRSVVRMALAATGAGMRFAGLFGGFHAPATIIEPNAVDDDRVREVAGSFHILRPLIPRIGRCLPQALVLRDFLALHGVETQIVFGVRSSPFEAHCWVERRGLVINDTVDHIRQFAPIYAC